MTDDAPERVVLVDSDGHAIGQELKDRVHGADTPLHLAFSCYVFDIARRVLLTRRADRKVTWPGVWTNSCCGHPAPDEPIEAAVARRLRHELGLVVQHVDLMLPSFRYRAVMANGVVENELCPVFRAVTPGEPAPYADEVGAVRWVPWGELVAAAREGKETDVPPISPWCADQVPLLDRLGPDPLTWPTADPGRLPPAAVRGMSP